MDGYVKTIQVMVFLTLAMQITHVKSSCPEGWLDADYACIKVTAPMTWNEGRAACQAMGYDLATPDTPEKTAAVVNIWKTKPYWGYFLSIGMTRSGPRSKTFVWINGQTVTWEFWSGSNPTNSGCNEDCVQMTYTPWRENGEWNDFPCYFKRKCPALCQMEKATPTTQPTTTTTLKPTEPSTPTTKPTTTTTLTPTEPSTPTTQPTTTTALTPFKPRVTSPLPPVGVHRGGRVTLSCSATGWPRPMVYWRRNGNRVKSNSRFLVTELQTGTYNMTSQLLLRSVAARDYGIYKCVARNINGWVELSQTLYET